jgi:aminopeptidase
MKDSRITNMARLLVRYCVRAGKSDSVGVLSSTLAEPLVAAVCEELIRAGSFPVPRLTPHGLSEFFFKHGKPHHFSTLPPYERAFARSVDATINIHSQANTRELTNVVPSRQTAFARTRKPIGEVLRRKPWVITLYPTPAYAQDAEMSLRDFEDYVFSAVFVDQDDPVAAWKALKKQQDRLISRIRGADHVRIAGRETDLRLSIKDRLFVNSDGRRNMPSGEIFTAPHETSAEGYITFDYPVCYMGREVSGVRLVFRKGVVVEATADRNQKFLCAMLDTDKGARRLGELGIGTNRSISRFIRNILFDEKIGGTIHLALGRSPVDTGGRNNSAIHWDMIKDLRKGGAVYLDGKVFQKDGKFVKG